MVRCTAQAVRADSGGVVPRRRRVKLTREEKTVFIRASDKRRFGYDTEVWQNLLFGNYVSIESVGSEQIYTNTDTHIVD